MKLTGHWSISSLLALLLSVASVVVGLGMVIAAGLAAMSLFAHLPGGELDIPVAFHVDAQALALAAPELGVPTAEIHDVSGSLKFRPPAGNSVVPVALVGITFMLCLVLWGLGQMRAVFRTLHNGQPFVPANARRIRSVGLLVIFGEIGRATLVFFTNTYAMAHFSANGLRFDADFRLNVFAIIHGLIILVIAEVFRAGTQLAEDQSLTI